MWRCTIGKRTHKGSEVLCLCDAGSSEDLREPLLLGPARTRAAALRPDSVSRTDRLELENVKVRCLTRESLDFHVRPTPPVNIALLRTGLQPIC
jgi:hypothetical protein